MIERIKQLVKDKSDPELHVSQRIGAQRELSRCGSEYAEYLVGEVERLQEDKKRCWLTGTQLENGLLTPKLKTLNYRRHWRG